MHNQHCSKFELTCSLLDFVAVQLEIRLRHSHGRIRRRSLKPHRFLDNLLKNGTLVEACQQSQNTFVKVTYVKYGDTGGKEHVFGERSVSTVIIVCRFLDGSLLSLSMDEFVVGVWKLTNNKFNLGAFAMVLLPIAKYLTRCQHSTAPHKNVSNYFKTFSSKTQNLAVEILADAEYIFEIAGTRKPH